MRNTRYFNIDENRKFIENYYDYNNAIKNPNQPKGGGEDRHANKLKAHRNAFSYKQLIRTV